MSHYFCRTYSIRPLNGTVDNDDDDDDVIYVCAPASRKILVKKVIKSDMLREQHVPGYNRDSSPAKQQRSRATEHRLRIRNVSLSSRPDSITVLVMHTKYQGVFCNADGVVQLLRFR